MGLHRFHCPGLEPGVNELPPEEAHHAAAALRLKPGDQIEVFDGAGLRASAVAESVTRRSVSVRVEQVEKVAFELRHRLTLAVAMSKAHRQGYLVEKCTELGVAAIWPIIANRSVTQPGDAAVEKWSRRAVEAAKQSGRCWVPTITSVASIDDALSRVREFPLALFCDLASDSIPVSRVFMSSGVEGSQIDNRKSTIENSIIAFVGPEGGWSDDERHAAREAGLTSVSLSPTILRAETAAVALCAAVAAQQ